MDRDVAVRLDGMLFGAHANLDGIAHYMKNNLSADDYSRLAVSIGTAMAALMDISSDLHSRFADIVPKELRPPGQ